MAFEQELKDSEDAKTKAEAIATRSHNIQFGIIALIVITLGIFLLCFVGLGISVFPDVVPGAVTIWDAATDHSSQVFMLWGTAFVLPMILGYTAWSYWVFRGKVTADGYHA